MYTVPKIRQEAEEKVCWTDQLLERLLRYRDMVVIVLRDT